MIGSLKLLLSSQFKQTKRGVNTVKGFTLIELLVGIVLAVLVITPLLGFMIDVMNNDRKEQAKATTEQEIQTALDYIARDLQQAVYIYDNDGITRDLNTSDVDNSGIRNQIPPVKPALNCSDSSKCVPILVFWKREFVPSGVGVSSATDTQKDDAFVYSLVGYYQMTNSTGQNSSWSTNSAQIGRFEIHGGVNSPYVNPNVAAATASYSGFNPPPPLDPNTKGNTIKEKMSQWQGSTSYDQNIPILIDYIDKNTASFGAFGGSCSSPQLVQVSSVSTQTDGFSVCVDAANTLAKVYLRGNALARLSNNSTYNSNNSAYFPSVNVQVQGRGFLFTK